MVCSGYSWLIQQERAYLTGYLRLLSLPQNSGDVITQDWMQTDSGGIDFLASNSVSLNLPLMNTFMVRLLCSVYRRMWTPSNSMRWNAFSFELGDRENSQPQRDNSSTTKIQLCSWIMLQSRILAVAWSTYDDCGVPTGEPFQTGRTSIRCFSVFVRSIPWASWGNPTLLSWEDQDLTLFRWIRYLNHKLAHILFEWRISEALRVHDRIAVWPFWSHLIRHRELEIPWRRGWAGCKTEFSIEFGLASVWKLVRFSDIIRHGPTICPQRHNMGISWLIQEEQRNCKENPGRSRILDTNHEIRPGVEVSRPSAWSLPNVSQIPSINRKLRNELLDSVSLLLAHGSLLLLADPCIYCRSGVNRIYPTLSNCHREFMWFPCQTVSLSSWL
jgi:hypothetical protein